MRSTPEPVRQGEAATASPCLLLQMRGIAKSFPGVAALRGVDFDLRPAEIHCLIGENGAVWRG